MRNYENDEMLDDLHSGVEALRSVANTNSISLSEKAVKSLKRLESSVPVAQKKFQNFKERVKEQAVKAAQQTDEAAHNHPWKFTLGALGVGLIVGLLLSGSDDDK
jgi:ElaB/YqjD/DUF883 family membrane-anchored ribosome-binding protein